MSENNLIEELKILRKQKKSKAYYAEKLGVTEEKITDLLNQIKGKVDFIAKKVEGNLEDGNFRSEIELDFEPKGDLELAELHKVDLKLLKHTTSFEILSDAFLKEKNM